MHIPNAFCFIAILLVRFLWLVSLLHNNVVRAADHVISSITPNKHKGIQTVKADRSPLQTAVKYQDDLGLTLESNSSAVSCPFALRT